MQWWWMEIHAKSSVSGSESKGKNNCAKSNRIDFYANVSIIWNWSETQSVPMNFGDENACHVLMISKPWPIDRFTLGSNGNTVTQLSDISRSGLHKKWLAERSDFTPQRTDVNLIWSAMTFPTWITIC